MKKIIIIFLAVCSGLLAVSLTINFLRGNTKMAIAQVVVCAVFVIFTIIYQFSRKTR